jgi:predicted AlkP superfamily phosphohydrolase/phosphomutase
MKSTRTTLFVCLAFLACTPAAERGRVVVIGIDGASEKVIAPLVYAGALPNLAALRETGLQARMRAEGPLLSPIIWTSVATGKSVEGHGIRGWVWEDEEGERRLYASGHRKTHALWNMLSDHGKSVAVVNWLVTHPPEVINGVMISDHALPRVAQQRAARFKIEDPRPWLNAPYATPERWVARFAELQDATDPLTPIANPFSGPEPGAEPARGLLKFVHAMHAIFENDTLVMRAALEIEAEQRPDLLMVYLPGIDRVSHQLWVDGFLHSAADPARQDARDPRLRSSAYLATYYRYTDALIGRLLERYGPNDLVIVLSDHGFESDPESESGIGGTHKTERARNGILYVRGPGISIEGKDMIVGVHAIAPIILGWFGLPAGVDLEGRAPPFMGLEPLPPIDTYDTTPIERLPGGSPVEEERIDELRSLGYVE